MSCPARPKLDSELGIRTGHATGPDRPPCELIIPDQVVWEDGLSEDEAVACGLWNNPAYQELLADLRITEADLLQASQLQNPVIDTVFPVGPKQWEFLLRCPVDVLWLRPIRVAAAELESHRVARRLVQDGLDVMRDVRVAYADWQLALSVAELAERGAQLRADIARVAEGRLSAGAVAELDVSAMRLDAMFGRAEAVQARRDAELAAQRLRYLLGIQLADFPIEPAEPTEVPETELDVDRLLERAVTTRPDLRAIQLAICAAQERVNLARRDIWKLFGVLPDINARGRKGFEAGPGLQFALPLFHQNQGEIAQAAAQVDRLRRQYARQRDLAAWEVQQAYVQLVRARQELAIWRDQVVPQAQRAARSAQLALEEDGVSLLLVLETTRQLLTANQRELEAGAQLRRAFAELERSVGGRLADRLSEPPAAVEVLPLPQEGKIEGRL